MLTLPLLLLLVQQTAPSLPDSAADAATLRDGRVILGQCRALSRESGGYVDFLVRREWAREHFPDRVDAWEGSALSSSEPARLQRLDRLRAWRRDLPANPQAPDLLASRLDAEIARLDRPAESPAILPIRLPAREVVSLKRRPEEIARLLRHGWLAGFRNVEEMPSDRLVAGLADRNLSPARPAPIDSLLPLSPEPEARWIARRAATEALQEPSLRYIRHGDLVLPEASQADPQALLGSMLGSALRQLVDDPAAPAENPLEALGRQIAAKGRVGLVVTQLETSPSLDQVTVTSTLYARVAPARWQPAARRSSTIRAADAPPADPIAADPQIQSLFSLLDSLAPGAAGEQARTLSLQIGSATRLALSQAREALDADLNALALSFSP